MSDVSQILQQIDEGDANAAEDLLPLVYEELRQLAAVKLSHEKAGQTLQATALVNEAFLRLVENVSQVKWNGKGHFFGAAAIAMRRILVERARKKASLKAGGDRQRIDLSAVDPEIGQRRIDLLDLDEALNLLEEHDPRSYQVVHLRFFAGLTIDQTAKALGMSKATVENDWVYAKSWLKKQLKKSE